MTEAAVRDTFVEDLFASIDSRDADAFAGHLTRDAVLRFGSAQPVQGVEAVRNAIEAFFGSIGGLVHDIAYVHEADNRLLCEGEVTYTRLDGSTVTLPFADILLLDPAAGRRRIREYRIYIDIGPLYATTG